LYSPSRSRAASKEPDSDSPPKTQSDCGVAYPRNDERTVSEIKMAVDSSTLAERILATGRTWSKSKSIFSR
jgi:hypothetical protein